MGKRYTINSEFVFEDCLVTPSAYEGVLQRFDEFVAPYIAHLHTRSQKVCCNGLMSSFCRSLVTFIRGRNSTKRVITCEDFCPTPNEKMWSRFLCFAGGEPGTSSWV